MLMWKLYNNHSIAIAEEAILFFYSCLVGMHRQIIAGKSTNHYQQASFWQMEVGNQAIRY